MTNKHNLTNISFWNKVIINSYYIVLRQAYTLKMFFKNKNSFLLFSVKFDFMFLKRDLQNKCCAGFSIKKATLVM